jgi:hypothetical protein
MCFIENPVTLTGYFLLFRAKIDCKEMKTE